MNLNTPFSGVMPPLPADKYAALKADIEQAGLIKSILIDEENNILDGHHRYRACNEIGIAVKTERVDGIGDARSKVLRIIALNLAEREMTPEERARLDAERKKRAMELLGEGRGPREVGRLVGKSHSTIIDWRAQLTSGRSDQPAQVVNTTDKPTSKNDKVDGKTKNMSPEAQKKRALELSSSGMRPVDIAVALGLHSQTISNWIENPHKKPRAPQRGAKPRKLSDSDVERLFNSGLSVAEIASKLGANPHTIGTYLKRLGLSRAGKRAANPLLDRISLANSQAEAWLAGSDSIAAAASVSSPSQVSDLVAALARLARAASTLKGRLNKDAGKEER